MDDYNSGNQDSGYAPSDDPQSASNTHSGSPSGGQQPDEPEGQRNEMNEIKMQKEQYDLGGIRIPSLKRRFAAFLIDIVLMLFIGPFAIAMSGGIVSRVIMRVFTSLAEYESLFYNMSGLLVFFYIVLYFPVFEYFRSGISPGKGIAKIRLVAYREENDRLSIDYGRISFLKLVVRNFLKLVWYMPAPVIFALAAFVLMYDDKLNRAFYDKVLKTIVISTG